MSDRRYIDHEPEPEPAKERGRIVVSQEVIEMSRTRKRKPSIVHRRDRLRKGPVFFD